MKYNLISYDVWGNKSDGWEVNDCRYTGIEIELPDDFTDTQLKRELYKSGYASKSILMAKITCEGEAGYTLYINLTANKYQNKPFCELRKVD